MHSPSLSSSRPRRIAGIAGASALALAGTLVLTSPSGVAATTAASELELGARHRVIKSGLDNPRQVGFTRGGAVYVAEAGHGSSNPDNCSGGMCIGFSGRVTVIRPGGKTYAPMKGLLSAAGEDGSFAVGSDGASKRLGGTWYSIITYAPPESFPDGIKKRQAGKLLAKRPGGKRHVVANIARFEKNRNPDGEQIESNPYSVLALKNQVLVADAAGDYIASLRNGKLRVWAVMPEYGKRVDAVPTVLSRGGDGTIYVGELHSEKRGKAKVHQFNRKGELLRSWGGFTTVTGVDVKPNGTMYVSELFGGDCGFGDIPSCFPGRVVKVKPNGKRSYRPVPFPAGVAVRGDRVVVAAFSISPGNGFGGNPDWAGQLWRLKGF